MAKARELAIDLAYVAPDDPLAWGLADRLAAAGIAAFGPSKAAAQIEASKSWAKEFMTRHGIAYPASAAFDSFGAALEYVVAHDRRLVVKADGLAAGKGAIVTMSRQEAVTALDQLMTQGIAGAAGRRVVIEDWLSGREVSAHAFSDGKTALPMPLSCDHKAVFDHDAGPNTGGMGVYSPPWWADAALGRIIHESITLPTIASLDAEGRPFRGVLYPQVMVTDSGLQIIEYNARFGDPEAQALLVRLDGDLLDVAWAAANGTLDRVSIAWRQEASVCVVIASSGYPGEHATGMPISGLEDLDPAVQAFHAGTRRRDDGTLVTAGGRVLGIVATATTLEKARATAYDNVARLHFEGMHYRRDIGLQPDATPGAPDRD